MAIRNNILPKKTPEQATAFHKKTIKLVFLGSNMGQLCLKVLNLNNKIKSIHHFRYIITAWRQRMIIIEERRDTLVTLIGSIQFDRTSIFFLTMR